MRIVNDGENVEITGTIDTSIVLTPVNRQQIGTYSIQDLNIKRIKVT
jgi:hypothetical protein